MGFSILSIVEILYYFTLRLACNLNRRRQANKIINIKPSDNVTKLEIVRFREELEGVKITR
jgi:hypothetical protein